MFRIVTARYLRALRADVDKLTKERDRTAREAADARGAAELANDSAIRATLVCEQQLEQLGQAYADNIKLQRENAERFAGLQAVIKQVTAERDAARTLTPNEHDRAWHAIEGAAGQDDADPGTVLNAVLRALRINSPTVQDEQAASPGRRTAERLVLAVADLDSGEQPDTDTAGLDDAVVRREGILALATVFAAAFSSPADGQDDAPGTDTCARCGEARPTAMYPPGSDICGDCTVAALAPLFSRTTNQADEPTDEYDGVGIHDPWAPRRDDTGAHTDPWPTTADGVDLRTLAAESAAARLDTDTLPGNDDAQERGREA